MNGMLLFIFHIKYEMEFHGKMFRDNEVAFVYAYEKPVDETKLVLQTEEVEEVKWLLKNNYLLRHFYYQ